VLFRSLIGDRVYGDGRHNRFIRETFHVGRLLLSASSISFNHPFTGAKVYIRAEMEENMARLVQALFGINVRLTL
jgi:tRNA pseudouridine65 synthase